MQSPPVTGTFDQYIEAQNNQLANQQNVAAIKLLTCLKPQPIATEQPAIAEDVIDNLDWNVKIKALERLANQSGTQNTAESNDNNDQANTSQTPMFEPSAQSKAIDVEGWLAALKASRTKAAFLHGESHQGLKLTA